MNIKSAANQFCAAILKMIKQPSMFYCLALLLLPWMMQVGLDVLVQSSQLVFEVCVLNWSHLADVLWWIRSLKAVVRSDRGHWRSPGEGHGWSFPTSVHTQRKTNYSNCKQWYQILKISKWLKLRDRQKSSHVIVSHKLLINAKCLKQTWAPSVSKQTTAVLSTEHDRIKNWGNSEHTPRNRQSWQLIADFIKLGSRIRLDTVPWFYFTQIFTGLKQSLSWYLIIPRSVLGFQLFSSTLPL